MRAVCLALGLGMGGAWAQAPLACPAGAEVMSRLELVFGLTMPGGRPIGDKAFRRFLDREVTPRFPDGLTLLSGDGQWRNRAGRITKEPSRLLLVWYRASPDSDQSIEAIREAYKKRFRQDSVLRVDGAGCVRF